MWGMLALKIVFLAVGLGFTLFGYFILFRKKYSLINGFRADYEAGLKSEEYAKKVGLVDFMLGIAFLITGFLLVIFA